ncbi:hypothetical protein IV203_000319 [Nitzschia inconspicua]|uniref:Uncharacterized protein n=1 Tax=Nitzschia inconspicua TaxID=303405 RepID=A0A9K3PQI8_9STRA|nr:hypothetical protein IV203_000319 [Nitzschia inconspicua]
MSNRDYNKTSSISIKRPLTSPNNALVVKYSWIVNLKQNPISSSFLANSSREFVRVMGTIVAVQDISPADNVLVPLLLLTTAIGAMDDGTVQQQQNSPSFKVVTLDDGTETISIWTHCSMIETLIRHQQLQQQQQQQQNSSEKGRGQHLPSDQDDPALFSYLLMGLTVDCILKLRQSASHQRWFAETLIPLHSDLIQEQQFRWILLSHQDKQHQRPSSVDCSPRYSHDYGFPTRRRHDPVHLYKLVCANAKIQQKAIIRKQEKENLWMGKRQRLHEKRRHHSGAFKVPLAKPTVKKDVTTAPATSTDSRTASNMVNQHLEKTGQSWLSTTPAATLKPTTPQEVTSSPPPPQLKGLTLENLSCVMQIPKEAVRAMTQELQMEGRIYCNGEREYLPL